MTIASGSRAFIEEAREPLKPRDNGSKHGKRVFTVVSSDNLTTLADIAAHANCPSVGDGHPDDSAVLMRRLDPELVDGFENLHRVTCHYDSQATVEEQPDDPTTALIKAGFRAEDHAVPAFFDAYGRPNVNTAGDLIEGLVRIENQYIAPVTVNRTEVPLILFTLNNTLNDRVIKFRGIEFPVGTLTLKNMSMPDEPEESGGTEYWPLTFDIIHKPDGFFELHPNRGKHENVYQVREEVLDDEGASFDPVRYAYRDAVSYSEYDGTEDSDRRVIKRRIKTDDKKPAPSDVWLDYLGRAVRTPTIRTEKIPYTGTIIKNSKILRLSGSYFNTDPDNSHEGASIAVAGAGPHGRILRTRIASVDSETVAVLEDPAGVTADRKDVWLPGVLCLRIVNQPLANWSDVFLPDNDPS